MKSKPDWIERVKATFRFHVDKCKQDSKWTQDDTAKALKRSKGMISQELQVARWLRTHSAQLEEIEHFHDAIDYVRKRRHHLLLETDLD